MNKSDIYRKFPLPKSYGFDDKELDNAIAEVKEKGFKALWKDEGEGEFNFVFVIK